MKVGEKRLGKSANTCQLVTRAGGKIDNDKVLALLASRNGAMFFLQVNASRNVANSIINKLPRCT